MDSLVEKYVKGELTDEQFDAERAKLSGEDQGKVDDLLKSKVLTVRDELKALTAEKVRRQAKLVEEPTPAPVDQFRMEQLSNTERKFFTDKRLDEATQARVKELFKKHDTGKLTPEGMTEDLTKAYIEAKGPELLSAAERLQEMEKDAALFNAQGAGAGGSSGGGDDTKKYDPAVIEFVAKARKNGEQLSLDAAERYLQKGLSRTF